MRELIDSPYKPP
ncbi:hypothetical protein CGLO_10509 [Colletotrichum gloeosporioides Cg-14]|uniref:Uncharacterized protein n=1 Tax=Colletotrichum gloeosporioides (strain Cg-14) TaxID=1237896 RepID=T0KDC4_COLGC|nr:hypothetical protein CGLO_10509 [Colletotrichum gloeosporioides Cg-14]